MEHVIVHRVHEPGMAEAVGRLAAFEAALADRGVTVIDSQGDGVDGQKYFVEAESASATHVAEILQKTSRFGTVEPGNEISLITLVGFMLENRILDNIFNLALNSGIDGKIWQTEGFPISTGQNSLRIGVSPDAAKEVLGRLHEASVESRL